MDRYIPAKDLPQDIKSLPREETVCRFCGVSYLVHHEMKNLEETIADLRRQLQRKLDLENEKKEWCHEKDKMEHFIAGLEKDLAALKSVKTDLEMEKALWEQERHKLLLSVTSLENDVITTNQYMKEIHNLKEVLSIKEDELSRVTSSAREKEALLSFKFTNVCALLKQVKFLHNSVRQDQKNLLNYFLACFGKVMQACSELNAKVSGWLKSGLADLQSALLAEKSRYTGACEGWASVRSDLMEQIKHKEKQNQNLTTELLAAQEAKSMCSSELAKYKDMHNTRDLKVRNLETELSKMQSDSVQIKERYQVAINELQGKLSNTEGMLADAKAELFSLKDLCKKEKESKQEMHKLLEDTQLQLLDAKMQIKQLSASYELQIQKVHEHHSAELREIKEFCEKQSKVNFEKSLAQLRSEQEVYCKQISELKVTVENQRITIHQLHEEIRKEKAVFDAEVTRHLHEVKDLEMRIQTEHSATHVAQEAKSVALKATVDQLEAKKKLCSELESKLMACFKEISNLQTTVQRGCEERHELEKDLEESRAALKKLSSQERLRCK